MELWLGVKIELELELRCIEGLHLLSHGYNNIGNG
jgi:hypothetical protein